MRNRQYRTTLGMVLCGILIFGLLICAPSFGQPCVEINANGRVFENPQYPYVGHHYDYDQLPGDNDMPALRTFASAHSVFQNIDMSQDWKDREWDMIKAIVHYTANTLSWADTSTVSQWQFRALTILVNNDACPLCQWACGDVSAAAVGLAQAHGIPARFIGGIDDDRNGDLCCEMFSTKFNRWIHLFPKGYNWMEQDYVGPLGAREILPFFRAGMVHCEDRMGAFYAIAADSLSFMPTPLNRAPIPPHFSEYWWQTQFQHLTVTTTTKPNSAIYDPNGMQYVFNDNFYNELYGYDPPLPIVQLDDMNVCYPLNNVEATVVAQGAAYLISLKNNMLEFVRYEAKIDTGNWVPIDSSGLPGDGSGSRYTWTPAIGSTLSIRGVNRAGAHSPDVVLSATATSLPGDLNHDGVLDGRDVQPFVMQALAADPAHPSLCTIDIDGNGTFDDNDVAAFVSLLMQSGQ